MRGTQMRSNSPDGRRKRGSTLVLFTLMLPTLLIPLMGLGIDATMLYIVQAKLSAATDGAALARAGCWERWRIRRKSRVSFWRRTSPPTVRLDSGERPS